jgi:ABC-type lipoprotein export system ATPase subunit
VSGEAPAGPAFRLDHVTREFMLGGGVVRALDDVTLEVARGTFVAITGRSGSGKSTFLNLLAGIDQPTRGSIQVDGVALERLDDDALTRYRRARIGMVHQSFDLLPMLSVRENVALPALLAGEPESAALERADRLLDEVELGERRAAHPRQLSGGEMQRVAVARALIHAPALILADEPTGNLDDRSAAIVIALLAAIGSRHGATVVLVTHSAEAAAVAQRRIELRDGRVVSP